MTRAPRRRSLLLRYSLVHGLFFGCAVSAVLFFLYEATLGLEKARLDREIAEEASLLRGRLAGRTVTEMAAIVHRTTSDLNGRTSIYMLATSRREYVAGNLRTWPASAEAPAGAARDMLEFPLAGASSADDASGRVRGRSLALPAGERLFVGRNLAEFDRLRSLFGGAIAASLAATVLLGVAGGLFLSRSVSSRLNEINRMSEAILAGDLRRRVPVGTRGDEFDELAENLNRMLDRIEQLMAAMREVSDNVAHDLRSPISRLRSRIEVALMDRSADGDAYRRVLEQTVADTDAILAVFNALLTIAVVESGAPRERFVPVDLAEIAREGFESYEPVADEAGLRLILRAPEPVRIRGDPRLLAQATANLLDNAVKHVPRGGRVELAVDRDADRARLVVSDDGPGIDEGFRARAFDRFTRTEKSRTTPGSGLGLSLVRAVARLHGGDVRLEDARPGLRVVVEVAA
jgi:signal transduction histidine kinase